MILANHAGELVSFKAMRRSRAPHRQHTATADSHSGIMLSARGGCAAKLALASDNMHVRLEALVTEHVLRQHTGTIRSSAAALAASNCQHQL